MFVCACVCVFIKALSSKHSIYAEIVLLIMIIDNYEIGIRLFITRMWARKEFISAGRELFTAFEVSIIHFFCLKSRRHIQNADGGFSFSFNCSLHKFC